MIKVKENTTRAPVAPPPVLNGSKAPKAKPKRKAAAKPPAVATGEVERECPTCKRPFAMSPAERQRKRRAKLAALLKKGKK